MATKIIIKNSSVAGKVPDGTALDSAELAVNLKDQKLYSKDADGNVFELGRGSTDSGGTGGRPTGPEIGDLYFDTDLEILLVWNGSEWEQITTGGDSLWVEDAGKLYPVTLTNDVQIGGTAADPNIELKADGTARFTGRIFPESASLNYKQGKTGQVFGVYEGLSTDSAATIQFDNDGSATFEGKITAASTEDSDPDNTVVTKDYLEGAGTGGDGALGYWDRTGTSLSPVNQGDDVLIGGTLPSAPNISLNASDGSGEFNGQLLVGTSNSKAIGTSTTGILQVAKTSHAIAAITTYANTNSGGTLILGKSRAGSIGGNTIVEDGDFLGEIRFAGADGNNINSNSARIYSQVDGTPGSTDMPGRLVFSTTANGESFPTERMRIDSSGRLGLGESAPDTADVKVTRLTITDSTSDGLGVKGRKDSLDRWYVGYNSSDHLELNQIRNNQIVFKTNKCVYHRAAAHRLIGQSAHRRHPSISAQHQPECVGIGNLP